MKYRYHIFLSLLIMASCSSTSQSEDPAEWTQDQVNEWYDSKEWLGESAFQPDGSVDKRRLAIEYHENQRRWDAAFAFIRKGDFSMAVGDYPLDGENAVAKVSEYNSKNPDDAFFEAHKKFADIQFVVSGEELIGHSDLTDATVKEPYDADKDIAFYQGSGPNLLAKPGTFFIFFPGQGHRPGMMVENPVPVKKIVIKVRAD